MITLKQNKTEFSPSVCGFVVHIWTETYENALYDVHRLALTYSESNGLLTKQCIPAVLSELIASKVLFMAFESNIVVFSGDKFD